MKKIIVYAGLLLAVSTYSCNKYVDNGNESPNKPSNATPAALLSYSSLSVQSSYNGSLSRTTSIFMQHAQGTLEQYQGISTYSVLESDFDNDWDKIWVDGMTNAKQLEKVAGTENPWYQGIAKIHQAMLFGLATDLWGDIPFSEAGQALELGEAGYYPKYDPQETVLQGIQALLDQAIVLLNKDQSQNILLPGNDDLILAGDNTRWVKCAYALKARYANRLSKRDASGSATQALGAIAQAGFTSSDDVDARYGSNPNEYNQWYAFNFVERANYLKMNKKYVDTLVAMNDPRLPFICTNDDNGAYSGTASDDFDVSTSNPGPYYASPASTCELISYAELKFIEAECQFRLNDKAAAAMAHNEAVKASILKITGSSDATYETANASETAGTISLEKIMFQKWLASFTKIEVWTDWRRTGLPSLTPSAASTLGEIPRRLPTPSDERINNPNATVVTNLLQKVWFDQ
jgi:hypothetical protein